MRNKNNKHLGIEIDPELHYKLHYISKYYGRSANGEILYLIRQEIKNFEKNEGKIEIPDELKTNWLYDNYVQGGLSFEVHPVLLLITNSKSSTMLRTPKTHKFV